MLSLEGGLVHFRHELARRAIEASITPTRRRALHQKVVDVLKRRADARASEIAHHAERAGDIAVLLKFAQRAGQEATRAGAAHEAAAHFAVMLRHRDALETNLVVDALEQHAEQAYLMGSADMAMVSMTEAAALRRRAGETLKLGHDLTRLTRFAWMCGLRAEAERFVEEAIAVLQAAPPGRELAWAYSHQSQLDMLASRMDRAISWGERALKLARQLGEQEIIIHALGNIGSAKCGRSRVGLRGAGSEFRAGSRGQVSRPRGACLLQPELHVLLAAPLSVGARLHRARGGLRRHARAHALGSAICAAGAP